MGIAMALQFKMFTADGWTNKGSVSKLGTALAKAQAFANTLDRKDLVCIAHGHQETFNSSVVVWYWDNDDRQGPV